MALFFVNRFFYPDASATSQIVSELAFWFASEGAAVRVVTSRQNYHDVTKVFPAAETVKGVTIFRVGATRFGRAKLLGRFIDSVSFMAVLAVKLFLSAKKNDTVVVMTDPPLVGWVVLCVARLKGCRHINWTQDIFPETAAILGSWWTKSPIMSLLKYLRDCSLRGASLNVAIGERMAEYMHSRRVPAAKVRVIHNWSDGRHIRPVDKDKNALRKEWCLEGKFVIGYSGNMGRVHEFKTILDAAESLLKDPRYLFLFTADGFQKDVVMSQASERKLTNIRFRSPQRYEELSLGLGVSDLHLVSLREDVEGLVVPSKFYGIAAAGVPSVFIGDADGEIARLIQRHDCGVVIKTGDSRALAGTIRTLGEDKKLIAEMGINARKMFEEYFDQQRAFRRWKEMIG